MAEKLGEKKKPGELDSSEMDSYFPVDTSAKSGNRTSSKSLRKINPLGMRVVIRIRRDQDRTEAGLYLPEGAKQSMQESLLGEVIEVASAIDSDTEEEANISGIPEGSLVLIPKSAGVRIPWDEDLRIVETKEVLALVHEMNVL